MANKALMLGVGIFITLAITSGVLMVIDNIKTIYSDVNSVDTNISSSFSEFDKYDNTEILGIDLKNAIKKYKGSNFVKLYIGASSKNILTTTNGIDDSQKYKCTLTKKGDIVEIHFIKK